MQFPREASVGIQNATFCLDQHLHNSVLCILSSDEFAAPNQFLPITTFAQRGINFPVNDRGQFYQYLLARMISESDERNSSTVKTSNDFDSFHVCCENNFICRQIRSGAQRCPVVCWEISNMAVCLRFSSLEVYKRELRFSFIDRI